MAFLAEAVKGRHDATGEDRLTQIFCASFNESAHFRNLACNFLGVEAEDGFKAFTQIYAATRDDSRFDIQIINRHGSVRILIECKLGAPLTRKQLLKYNRARELSDCTKVALVKHVPTFFEPPPGWEVRRWSKLYEHLEIHGTKTTGIDGFIIREFIGFLGGLGMAMVTEMRKDDIKCLADGLKQLRFDPKPDFSLDRKPFLKSALDFVSMLESVTEAARTDAILSPRISEDSRSGPRVSYWWKDESEKQKLLMIVTHISLRKAHRKQFHFLGTGLLFDKSGEFSLHAFLADRHQTWDEKQREIPIPSNKTFTLDYYSQKAITAWRSLLSK